MRTSRIVYYRALGAVAIAALLSGPAVLAQAATTTAPKDVSKQTEELKKRAAQLREALTKTRAVLDQSLVMYNTMVQGQSKDPSKDYKSLAKTLENLQKQRGTSKTKLAELETKSAEIYAAWEQEITAYSSESLQATGKERLALAKGNFAKVKDALKMAGDEYTVFLTNFNDQVRFMGRDLSPEALAALGPEAQKLNDQATALFKHAEEIRAVLVQNEGAMGAKPPAK